MLVRRFANIQDRHRHLQAHRNDFRYTAKKRVTYQKRYTVCKNICTLLNIYTIMLNAMSTIPGKYKREFVASTILLRNLKRYSPKNMSLT